MGATKVVNDHRGRFRGIDVAPRWSKLIDQELATFLCKEELFGNGIMRDHSRGIGSLLDQYNGPSIDAMVWRDLWEVTSEESSRTQCQDDHGKSGLGFTKKMAANKFCGLRIEKQFHEGGSCS